MTQTCTRIPSSPQQALKAQGPIDKALNVALFKALGDSTRLKLLSCMAKCSRSCSVTEVAACCDIDFSVVSRHLAVLARAGIITAEKSGRTVYYKVNYEEVSDAFTSLSEALMGCCGTKTRESCCGK